MTAEPAPLQASDPARQQRVPWSTIGVYSAPTVGVGFLFLLVNLYIMPFGTETLGMSAATLGTIIGISRLWDAVSDPLAGYLSDRTNTRLGRRRPWPWTRYTASISVLQEGDLQCLGALEIRSRVTPKSTVQSIIIG